MASNKRATTKPRRGTASAKPVVAKPVVAKPTTPKLATPMPLVADPAPCATARCPLPPTSAKHVVLLDDDVQVNDPIACEHGHLLKVVKLDPLTLVPA